MSFWPNVEPAVAYFDGHLVSADRILIDDTVFRYYFSPPLRQWQMVDPFYFSYGTQTGLPAYAAAVRDGSFDYVVLDGGIGEDAQEMQTAIRPNLPSRYSLRVSTPDPVTGHEIEIYERTNPAAMAPTGSGPQVVIIAPAEGALVRTDGDSATLSGTVKGIQVGITCWWMFLRTSGTARAARFSRARPTARLRRRSTWEEAAASSVSTFCVRACSIQPGILSRGR